MFDLRPVKVADKEQMRLWRNSPEVAKWMFTDHQMTEEEHGRWFDKMIQDPTCRYWIVTHEGRGIGVASVIGIDEKHSRCFWTLYLSSQAERGKGAGSFAEWFIINFVFDELRLQKLCGEVLAFNDVILRIHEQFGFRREGTLRRHVSKNGEFHDVILIGMFKEEWEQQKPIVAEKLRARGILPAASAPQGRAS